MKDTIQTLAEAMSRSFETAERRNGEHFRKLADAAPEWMTGVCRDAHDKGDMLPDDWRYRMIEAAIDALAGHEDHDTARERLEPFVYTSDLTGWLHSLNSRVYYLGEAMREYGTFDDGFKLLAAAQMMEMDEVFGQVLDALQSELDRRDHAAGPERSDDQPEPPPVVMDMPEPMRHYPSITAALLADPQSFLPESGPSNDNGHIPDRSR